MRDFIRQTAGGPKIGENFSMPSQKSFFLKQLCLSDDNTVQ
jgi:hypothetical protein